MRSTVTVVLIMLCFSSLPRAQERVFFGGVFPEMAITHSFGSKWQVTFKVESQQTLFENDNQDNLVGEFEHYRTDLQGFLAFKLNPFLKLSAGYQYRFEGDGPDSHRAIQQIAYIQYPGIVKLGHRLRLDQTFFTVEIPNEYRIRYRLSSEVPLSGQTLDPGEFYFLASNEVIFGVRGTRSEIENRLVGSVGHYFGRKAKLEAGLDWRIDRIIADGIRNRLWLKIGGFFNL